mgnify:CR=1 FL=1
MIWRIEILPVLSRRIMSFSLLVFTSFCFLKAGAGLVSDNSDLSLTEVEAAVSARITQQRLQTTPIQQMRPGMRVLGRNPDRWDTQSVVEPDPVSWRLVSVRMEQQQPGQFVLGQLLRPLSWIRQNDALPGAVIQLEIPEMYVARDAEVMSIADCPPIRRGPGSVVTGTFQHVSNEVISVFVEGESEPIGTTSQHPIWSRDRNAFVPAGELRIGEELKTALGTSTRVTSIEIRAGPETVYGLEVSGEHVYQITNAGLLVHNASGNVSQRTGLSVGQKTEVRNLISQNVPARAAIRFVKEQNLRPKDFGVRSIADDRILKELWADSLSAVSNRNNAKVLQTSLANIRKGTATKRQARYVFDEVHEEFVDRIAMVQAGGHSFGNYDFSNIHHWNWPIGTFNSRAIDPTNLFPVSQSMHEVIHNLTTSGTKRFVPFSYFYPIDSQNILP